MNDVFCPRDMNWKYTRKTLPTCTLVVDQRRIVDTTAESGWLLSIHLKSNSNLVRLRVLASDSSGTGNLDLNTTALELFNNGMLTPPGGIGFYTPKYDTVNSIYSIEFRPAWPALPYHKGLTVTVINEDTSSISITEVDMIRLQLISTTEVAKNG